jgi:rubredoxin-NAD+ reductase
MQSKKIVIIGSGLAGYSLVKELRKINEQIEIVLVTADKGDYYSKPQLSTAMATNRSAEDLVMNTAAQMEEKFNITVVTEKLVQNIDRENKRIIANKYDCSYDQLVLALGADKLAVPLSGDGVDDVQSVNTLEEYAVFRQWLDGKKRIGILGSGLVGCEFANDLISSGYEVVVMAPDQYPLQRFVPDKIGHLLKDALSAKGVKWSFGHFATEIKKAGFGYEVLLDNMEKVEVDGVFSAIGLRPRTELADLVDIAVERGIVTNGLLQTSDPNIYAFGDCAEVRGKVLLHIAPLLACARALAKTLNGDPTEVHYPAMPIIIKTPACPLNVFVPVSTKSGDWQYSGDSPNVEAQFVDSTGNLEGFALSGSTLRRRAELVKELPDLF